LGPAIFGIILLLWRGCPLSEVKFYCHGPIGTTKFVLYREVKCIVSLVSFKRGSTACGTILANLVNGALNLYPRYTYVVKQLKACPVEFSKPIATWAEFSLSNIII